ncbi:MAG: hypothetical protein EXQ81_11165 [Thermoleophilia bacterium]|nr:hypothetical protein [Thermoleophilia bacterium]
MIVALTLVGAVLAALTPTAGFGATSATSMRPTNLRVVINGSTLTNAQSTTGADTYLKVRAGRLTVGARWRGNVKGSGYYILISDSSSADKRRCRTGTTCTVAASKGLRRAQEMEWSIQTIRASTGVVVAQKIICLVGVA